MRVSNVRSSAGIQVNNVHTFGVQEGFSGTPKLTYIEGLRYRPNAAPGDSGYVELTDLRPGINEITIFLGNVVIPGGFLNLAGTPGPVSLTADITKNGYTPGPGSLHWDVRTYYPDRVGLARLQTGWLGINVVCL
jgi:hypothetical protein